MYKPKEIERKIMDFWELNKTYEKVKRRSIGGKKFYFNDGPPYATGEIHPGTAWNKCIKDAICRYMRFRGYNVRAQPGYDTHGLPIEVKVEQELKLKAKKDIEKVGVSKFIRKCKLFADRHIKLMTKQFRSVGVWMDWDRPYITYNDNYIEKSWMTLKSAHEKGLLEKGEYVLPWCPRCETSLANYELEYSKKRDPSIYVKFKVCGKDDEFLIIWTTTPWTLVANMAVMVHPEYTYVKVRVGEETWILAKELLPSILAVIQPLGMKADMVEEFSGRKLRNLKYVHPLLDEVPAHKEFAHRFHKIILSDRYVTVEEGTGLVHTAPGTGPEDFLVGKQYGIPPFCPVDSKGVYTSDAGKYKGTFVKNAEREILKDLKRKGLLLHRGTIEHRYPHCWRCKTPLIFLTTDQWFIKISRIRNKMLAEIDRCRWTPEFAKMWFKDFVENAPDWCISRQRYWGIPLPIWVCGNCGQMEVFGSKGELEGRWGKSIPELHKPYIDEVKLKCHCGGTMKRVMDVLDVWFDSGNAIWACLSDDEMKVWYPCDFIVEGKDQIRGWFYSLLGSGIVAYDEIPYLSLLMHGHFVDEHGEKMSKSLGNFVPLSEIIGKYGVDTFRLWSMGSVIWEDLKFNWDELREARKVLGILWNLHLFLSKVMEIEGQPPKRVSTEELDVEERWLLSKLNRLVKEVTEAYESYELHEADRRIRDFITFDLSRLYLKLMKKKLMQQRKKRASLYVLYHSLLKVCKLSSPIIPFITEEIYQSVFKKHERAESIFLTEWPTYDASTIDPVLEKNMEIVMDISRAIANARQTAKIKLRWPLQEAIVLTESTEVKNAVEHLSFIIEMLGNVKETKVGELKESKGYVVSDFENGKVFLKVEMSDELLREAYGREVARRIQLMRKGEGLTELDRIDVNVVAERDFLAMLKPEKERIKDEVRADKVILSEKKRLEGKERKWNIEGKNVRIIIRLKKRSG